MLRIWFNKPHVEREKFPNGLKIELLKYFSKGIGWWKSSKNIH